MDKNPKVSVIIPVYNREHLIQKAVNSILNQTYKNLEVIVVDDCSTDGTETKVREIKDPRVKFFKNEKNVGVSGSRNKGIKVSTGEIIAFQDSDDESYPARIEKEVDMLLNSPGDTGAVYCGQEFYDFKTGEKIGEDLRQSDFKKNFMEGSFILTPGTGVLMIKKSVLEVVGYLDENIRASVDVELAMRVSRKYNFAFVNEVLLKVTRNHNQIMGNQRDQILAKEVIYEKHKDFLSSKILYSECKMIANYYILTNDFIKARYYIVQSFKHIFKLKNLFQYLGLIFFTPLIRYLYFRKYKGEIPLTSGLKKREHVFK